MVDNLSWIMLKEMIVRMGWLKEAAVLVGGGTINSNEDGNEDGDGW